MYIRQSYQALYSKGIEIISQDISVQSERLEYSKPTELTFHCTETKGKAYFRKERVCILSSSEEKMKASLDSMSGGGSVCLHVLLHFLDHGHFSGTWGLVPPF